MNLTAATPGCTALASGGLSCTATVPAPVGTDTFSLTTYSGLNAVGALLATTQAQALVTGSGITQCTPNANGTPQMPARAIYPLTSDWSCTAPQ